MLWLGIAAQDGTQLPGNHSTPVSTPGTGETQIFEVIVGQRVSEQDLLVQFTLNGGGRPRPL